MISRNGTSAHLRHRHVASAWPWNYVADQRIALDTGGLTIELSVTNESREKMPAGLGLHPYFPLASGSRIGLSAQTVEGVDRCGFPMPDPGAASILRDAAAGELDPRVGSRYIGGVVDDARVSDAACAHVAILRNSGLTNFALHVEQESDLFCLEPMSHAVGALNAPDPVREGVRLLSPGERFTFIMRLDIEPAL